LKLHELLDSYILNYISPFKPEEKDLKYKYLQDNIRHYINNILIKKKINSGLKFKNYTLKIDRDSILNYQDLVEIHRRRMITEIFVDTLDNINFKIEVIELQNFIVEAKLRALTIVSCGQRLKYFFNQITDIEKLYKLEVPQFQNMTCEEIIKWIEQNG